MTRESDKLIEFQAAGEDAVRRDLEMGRLQGWRAKLAQSWLDELDRLSSASINLEHLRTAKSAKAAAWVAAFAAIIANIVAIWALLTAYSP